MPLSRARGYFPIYRPLSRAKEQYFKKRYHELTIQTLNERREEQDQALDS
jgi:hypothetical protein